MPQIFLSYRRTDAPGHAGRLYEPSGRTLREKNAFWPCAEWIARPLTSIPLPLRSSPRYAFAASISIDGSAKPCSWPLRRRAAGSV